MHIKNKILISDFKNIESLSLPWDELKNATILVTGATGFIGGYLVNYLYYLSTIKKLNIKIIIGARNEEKARSKFADVIDDINYVFKKIDLNKDIEIEQDINFIFHAASLASPKFFEYDPIGTILPNVLGTINLLQLSEHKNLKSFIFFSTTGVNGYVDDELRPIKEDKFGGLDPMVLKHCYLESKRMGESLCVAWHKQKKIPVKIIRPAITYGPGIDFEDGRSYADFISNILKNENIKLYSDGLAIRNYCYISDVISGIFFVLFYGNNGEAYNVATDKEISVLELADRLAKLFPKKNLKVVHNSGNKIARVEYKKTTVDISKVRALGWSINFDIEDGFRRSIEFYE